MVNPPTVLAFDSDSGLSLGQLDVRFKLHAFQSVGDALAGLTHLHPQVVVAALDGGGLDLCRHVLQRDPVMPVILLSRSPSTWDILEGMRAGARDVVIVEGEWVQVLEERVESAVAWRNLVEQDAEAQVQSFMIQSELYQQKAKAAEQKVQDLRLQLRAEKALITQTEQQLELQRELAMAAVRAKSTFLANMSHELHTPLNAIINYAEMLREDLGVERAEDADRIIDSGQRLLAMLQDVLKLAQLESGEVHPIFEPVNVQELVERCLHQVKGAASRNGVTLQNTIDPSILQVVSDPRRLAEAIGHLLDNAVKFGRGGEVSLSVQRSDKGIGFCVTDHGIGFEQEALDRMLSAFTQLDDEANRGFGGAGMGLAIASQLVRVLGGRLNAEGSLGLGASFEIWLPEIDDTTVEEGTQRGVTVLVIDDDPVLRRILQHMLVADGHRVITSATSSEGLSLARHYQPSLIALDVLLPGKDGLTLLGELKQDPDLRHIPVVMLSASQDHGRAVELGACAFLQKPVNREALQALIQTHARPANLAVVVVEGAPSSLVLKKHLQVGGVAVHPCAVEHVGSLAIEEAVAVLVPADLPYPAARTLLEAEQELPIFVCGAMTDERERSFLEEVFGGVLPGGPDVAADLREVLQLR